ncbi:MAG: hypothetical protein A3G81_22135 [Betaproteobacteria bacterium RIFCSPLOWO2_12_FULL_65_14]|nr:MAG: hypothetical protein A3G81_22135 [Betaproteobacteria bacterium RIFCSPLOWO2_12_FULL_65_14]
MNLRLKKFIGCWIAGVTVVAASTALGQDYPNKPVRAVVPFPPGGVVDIVARTLGQKMSESLGQPIIIENRGGAGGSIGTAEVARAPADGYTVLMAFDTHAVNPHIYKGLRFDIFKDFMPVSLIGNIPLVFAVPPTFPANSIPDLVKMAKAKPGAIAYGSVGAGSSGHLAAEQFKLLAGVDLLHVPYKGGAPALAALMGEQIQLLVFAASAAVPQMRGGKVKGLAVTGTQRSRAMQNVPTMAEAGYPQLNSGAWIGMVVPTGTPPEVISRLNKEILSAIKDQDIRTKLGEQAIELVGSTPQQFDAFIRAEHDKWGKLIKDAKLNIEQ